MLIDLTTKEYLSFEIEGRMLQPSDLIERKSANYNDVEVIGNSAPVPVFSASSLRSISFSLTFYGRGDEVEKKINFLKSLTYPAKSGNVLTTPPDVKLIWGNTFNCTGNVRDVEVQYGDVWDIRRGLPRYATVSIEFAVHEDRISAYDVRK
ncbi:hypothetical protein SAMN06269117_11311 [Balnearium lithotrophicum]|uniref:Contractile injection system tube protein N-terminal domain-containing protein n=2 Tax=Balnearium lithotrophicum TaxID=223788 RepID=A0A521CIS7_9BACT|nr:hypothetical protein SAMN06269117_11311 [Balnearium lithotrophicum]